MLVITAFRKLLCSTQYSFSIMTSLMAVTMLSVAPVTGWTLLYGIFGAFTPLIAIILWRFGPHVPRSLITCLLTLYVYYLLVVGFFAGYFIGFLIPILDLMKYTGDLTFWQECYRVQINPTIPALYVLHFYFIYYLTFFARWKWFLCCTPIFIYGCYVLQDMYRRNHIFHLEYNGHWEYTLDEHNQVLNRELEEARRLNVIERKRVVELMKNNQDLVEKIQIKQRHIEWKELSIQRCKKQISDLHVEDDVTTDFLITTRDVLEEIVERIPEHPHLTAQVRRLTALIEQRIGPADPPSDSEEEVDSNFEVLADDDPLAEKLRDEFYLNIPDSDCDEPKASTSSLVQQTDESKVIEPIDVALLAQGHKPRTDGPFTTENNVFIPPCEQPADFMKMFECLATEEEKEQFQDLANALREALGGIATPPEPQNPFDRVPQNVPTSQDRIRCVCAQSGRLHCVCNQELPMD